MRRRRRPYRGPSPSVDPPRPVLLAAVLQFACSVRRLAEVRRLALIGSLTTAKAVPKDADLLVVIDHDAELEALARAGPAPQGRGSEDQSRCGHLSRPPLELWPKVVRRCAPPEDVETLLLARLDSSVDPL